MVIKGDLLILKIICHKPHAKPSFARALHVWLVVLSILLELEVLPENLLLSC
jgi:hypothetical protein